MKNEVSLLAIAALDLTQTAMEIRTYLLSTYGNNKSAVYSNQGESIQSRKLIKMLNCSKKALQSFASKAQHLEYEIHRCTVNYEGQFRGLFGGYFHAHKVKGAAVEIEQIMKKTCRLGSNQAHHVCIAVDNLRYAARFASRNVNSSLAQQVIALDRGLR